MSELSGGEKVKAQMMRLLMEDVTVLLLDEPSNDIDLATLELLEKLIREWEHIVVFISHDETLIETRQIWSFILNRLCGRQNRDTRLRNFPIGRM